MTFLSVLVSHSVEDDKNEALLPEDLKRLEEAALVKIKNAWDASVRFAFCVAPGID